MIYKFACAISRKHHKNFVYSLVTGIHNSNQVVLQRILSVYFKKCRTSSTTTGIELLYLQHSNCILVGTFLS